MRAMVRLFGLCCVWTALGNLTGRRPRETCDFLWESVKRLLLFLAGHDDRRILTGSISDRLVYLRAELDDAIGPFYMVFDAIGVIGIAHEHNAVHGWIDGG